MPVASAVLKAMLETAAIMARRTDGWTGQESTASLFETPTMIADAIVQTTMPASEPMATHGAVCRAALIADHSGLTSTILFMAIDIDLEIHRLVEWMR
jgi:hypothetical protein